MAGRQTRSHAGHTEDETPDDQGQLTDRQQIQLLQQQVRQLLATQAVTPTPSPNTPATVAPSLSQTVKPIKSTKYPDPPVFSEADGDPSLNDWTLRIKDKLILNKDHFDNEQHQALYVIGRTGGTASKHILAYRENDPDYFKTAEEVLSLLNQVMGDPHKRANMRQEFKDLKQGSRTFKDFYSDFRRYASYLRMNELSMVEELLDKVTPQLQRTINGLATDYNTVNELSKVLAKVDDGERRIKATLASQKTSLPPLGRKSPPRIYATPYKQVTARPSIEPARVASRSVTPGVPNRSSPTPATASILCYNCSQHGHYASDCPTPRKIKEEVREMDADKEGPHRELSDEEATVVEEADESEN